MSLFGLRRAPRSWLNHGKRVATIGDNLVSICAFEKGRAKSWALNALARRAASYQIAARIRWHSRHVESKRNVADAGSRLHETGGASGLDDRAPVLPTVGQSENTSSHSTCLDAPPAAPSVPAVALAPNSQSQSERLRAQSR